MNHRVNHSFPHRAKTYVNIPGQCMRCQNTRTRPIRYVRSSQLLCQSISGSSIRYIFQLRLRNNCGRLGSTLLGSGELLSRSLLLACVRHHCYLCLTAHTKPRICAQRVSRQQLNIHKGPPTEQSLQSAQSSNESSSKDTKTKSDRYNP